MGGGFDVQSSAAEVDDSRYLRTCPDYADLSIVGVTPRAPLRVRPAGECQTIFSGADPGELADLLAPEEGLSPEPLSWLGQVRAGLGNLRDLDAAETALDPETLEQLKALGYVE